MGTRYTEGAESQWSEMLWGAWHSVPGMDVINSYGKSWALRTGGPGGEMMQPLVVL